MGVRKVALKGCGLDRVGRQNREQGWMSTKRFLVRSHNVAAGFHD
jgi:hypothetical protein